MLWGFGLAGGHVVRVAGDRPVAAAVAVASVLDGRRFLAGRSPRDLGGGAVAAVRDRLGSVVGRSHEVPVAGGPGEFGALPPSLASAYLDCVPPESEWRNATPARALLSLPRYRPGADADDVTCPALLVAGRDDALAPAAAVDRAAERMADATFLRLPGDHFDPFSGPAFEEALAHQLAFLDRVVGLDDPRAGT
ncbi:MAG: alpha/beta fold hydrolase [Haloplanus sp.]